MKKYITTISTQLETFNIVGIPERALYIVIKAYYNEDETLKLGGTTYSLKRIHDFIIHEFDNEELLDQFLKLVNDNNLKKIGLTGTAYIDPDLIEKYATNVSLGYLTIDRNEVTGGNENDEKVNKENQEILDGINELLERLSKIEMGQEIIYEDLRKDILEVKDFVGQISKKNIRQLIVGKLVDAGLGTVASEIINAIKESDILKIGS